MPLLVTLSRLAIMMILVGFFGFSASSANADTINVVGTTTGGAAANASASITGVAGSNILTVTLTNNLTNIVTRGSAISGFSFNIRLNGAVLNIPVTITSQSGRLVRFDDTTTAVDVNGSGVDALRWGVSSQNPIYLNGLGLRGLDPSARPPDELILGPSTTGMTWASANGSITQSDPAQPFVNRTATFTLTLGSPLPTGFQITDAQLYFGTNADTIITQVPEPASMFLLGTGLIGVAAGIRRRKALESQRRR